MPSLAGSCTARLILEDGTLESAVGLLVPYATYLVAEQAHASGVLAVVVAGLFLSHRSHQGSAATRVQDQAVWRAVTTLLEAVVFALIGLQLRTVVDGVSQDLERLVVAGIVLTAVAVLARAAWVFGVMYVPERLFGGHDPMPSQYAVIVSWSGMRGVVSLTAAFAIPAVTVAGAPFPFRAELMFLAFFVTLATLLLHGLTLPWLIRRLRATGDEPEGDALVQAQALREAARVGLERLEVLLAETQPPEEIAEDLRRAARRRSATRRGSGWGGARTNSATVRPRSTGGCARRCSPLSGRHWSRYATNTGWTTKSCARSCTKSTWRNSCSSTPDRPHRPGGLRSGREFTAPSRSRSGTAGARMACGTAGAVGGLCRPCREVAE
ncbi:cation:proton antiporter [Saccharopolyspora sp. 6V]|uniref:cation:proton antiporter n=1 Tax=Saccharopolyspora sp. 6V TaxID=2877239 RepID=UPI0027DFA8E5|nr:cation:proton antiporter [Saccharopolyspora sp. 6V]